MLAFDTHITEVCGQSEPRPCSSKTFLLKLKAIYDRSTLQTGSLISFSNPLLPPFTEVNAACKVSEHGEQRVNVKNMGEPPGVKSQYQTEYEIKWSRFLCSGSGASQKQLECTMHRTAWGTLWFILIKQGKRLRNV